MSATVGKRRKKLVRSFLQLRQAATRASPALSLHITNTAHLYAATTPQKLLFAHYDAASHLHTNDKPLLEPDFDPN
ncbi:hypothetical protein MY3957_000258 [Beauveria namnaoensis]